MSSLAKCAAGHIFINLVVFAIGGDGDLAPPGSGVAYSHTLVVVIEVAAKDRPLRGHTGAGVDDAVAFFDGCYDDSFLRLVGEFAMQCLLQTR